MQLTKSTALEPAEDGIRYFCVVQDSVLNTIAGCNYRVVFNSGEARHCVVEKTLLKRLARTEEIANATN